MPDKMNKHIPLGKVPAGAWICKHVQADGDSHGTHMHDDDSLHWDCDPQCVDHTVVYGGGSESWMDKAAALGFVNPDAQDPDDEYDEQDEEPLLMDPGHKAIIAELVAEVEGLTAKPKVGTKENPLPVPDDAPDGGYTHTFAVPSDVLAEQTVAQYLQQVNGADPQELVDHVMRAMGAEDVGHEATPAELVALSMTKVWLEGESQHAEAVAYSQGMTLKNHQAKYGDSCLACYNLRQYDKALDILRVQARQEVEQVQRQAQQSQFAKMGVCVECGKPPVDGRTYSLDAGNGFMCANCAGPHLLMDDGKPGNPWEDE